MTLAVWLVALSATVSTSTASEQRASQEVTIVEALESTRQNNITWQSLAELIQLADAGRDISIALFLPKLQVDGQWLHLGERNSPDMSGFATQAELLGTLTRVVIEEHPNRIADFLPFQELAEGGEEDNTFDSFVPPKNKLSATFSLIIPVINAPLVPGLQGAYDRYDAALQRVGHGREQLLFSVAKAYYGLVAMQRMIAVAERSIATAKEHYKSNNVKASLQAATKLDVKRAELEVTKAESQRAKLGASLEQAKAGFAYLSGIQGDFIVIEPQRLGEEKDRAQKEWLAIAKRERRDLIAARIEASAVSHDVDGIWAQYLPTMNIMGNLMADNAKEQRFDDDPWSWNVLATVNLNVWDGGIREANMRVKEATLRQAELAVRDLELKIASEVKSARQALVDARSARILAERQLEVARDTQDLTKASEKAGVVTNLEVIDINTMVFASEASYLSARLEEATAQLDLLAIVGRPVPFSDE